MKHLSIIRYVLLAVSALLVIVWALFMPNDSVDAMLYWCYALMAIAVGLLIILPTANMIKNPKGAMRSMIGLAIVVVLCVVFYSMGSAEPVPNSGGGFFEDRFTLKISDTGLYMTYVALAATILIAVYGEIRNSLK
ncbi:MAG: hypothetical protein LBU95_05925 [Rikenellaceae bacterium]|jgi:hypothetical protein|nr:hypothetical protein [Rikenellaceae bacterium]